MNTVFSRAPKFFAKTALAAALATALWTSAATAEPWHEADPQPLFDAFFQDFTSCDADTLSAYWGSDYYETKIRAGWKAINFGAGDVWQNHLLPKLASFDESDTIPRGYSWADCYWATSGFGYDDAETVACMWQQSKGQQITIDDAKLVIGLGYGMRLDLATMIQQGAAETGC